MAKKQKLWLPHSERIMEEELERNKDKVTCQEAYKPKIINCPKCGAKLAVHCGICETPITGCACGLEKRINTIKEEMWERIMGG